jgi:hypothetical protein
MRYRLRTLLILLTIMPPLSAGVCWAIRSGEVMHASRPIADGLLLSGPVIVAAYAAARLAATVTGKR